MQSDNLIQMLKMEMFRCSMIALHQRVVGLLGSVDPGQPYDPGPVRGIMHKQNRGRRDEMSTSRAICEYVLHVHYKHSFAAK